MQKQSRTSKQQFCILSIQKPKPNLERHVRTYLNKQTKQTRGFMSRKIKEREKEKFRLDTSHKSFTSFILTIPLSQIYSQTNKKMISNVKLEGLGPENVSIK